MGKGGRELGARIRLVRIALQIGRLQEDSQCALMLLAARDAQRSAALHRRQIRHSKREARSESAASFSEN